MPAGRRKLGFSGQQALRTLPGRIAALESTMARLREVLADPDLFARDSVRFSALSAELATADAVGKTIDIRRDVPKTIRGDALISLLGGCFGTSLIITSGENIGIVRATNVRSRYVTATAGLILVVLALFAPLGRLV